MDTVPLGRRFCPCSGGWEGAEVQSRDEAYRLFPSPGELLLLSGGGGSAFRGSECISLGYQETCGKGKYAVSSVTPAPNAEDGQTPGASPPFNTVQEPLYEAPRPAGGCSFRPRALTVLHLRTAPSESASALSLPPGIRQLQNVKDLPPVMSHLPSFPF